MSDSDEDELVQLRKERAARLGNAGFTVTALRNKFQADAGGAGPAGLPLPQEMDGPTVVDAAELGLSHAAAGAAPDPAAEESDDDQDGIPPELLAHLPASFGGGQAQRQQQLQELNRERQRAQARAANVGDLRPGSTAAHRGGEGPPRSPPGSDDEDAAERDGSGSASDWAAQHAQQEDKWRLPVTSEVALAGHERAVVALDWDHSGSRMATGSSDYKVNLYDFSGMKSDLRPFRSFEPSDGHPIVELSWSPSGDGLLVVTGSCQPKVYDRDGKAQGEMPRGDMYIRDMKNTKGHVSACTGGKWHPTDKGTGMTCSDDGSIRVWDMWTLAQKTVVKPTLARPGRVAVTTATYNGDGRLIAGGLKDGMLQLWDVRGKFGTSAAVGLVPQPKAQVVAKQTWSYVSGTGKLLRAAHKADCEVTCLCFSLDGLTLLSRSADETLKAWDLRKFKAPVAVAEGLSTHAATTGCCFSPDERLVVTALGAETAQGAGALAFFDRQDLTLVRRLGVSGSAAAVLWHPKINQIAVGCGDRKAGAAHILYDPGFSTRGAMLAVGRKPRQENAMDFTASVEPRIYNPNALPMFREQWPGGKRKKDQDTGERTSKSFRPETGPGRGVGAGGKLGTSGGSLLTQYVLKHQGQLKNPADEDVRASILRHADKQDEFSRFTAAYKETQPERLYAQPEEEEDEEEGAAGGGTAPK